MPTVQHRHPSIFSSYTCPEPLASSFLLVFLGHTLIWSFVTPFSLFGLSLSAWSADILNSSQMTCLVPIQQSNSFNYIWTPDLLQSCSLSTKAHTQWTLHASWLIELVSSNLEIFVLLLKSALQCLHWQNIINFSFETQFVCVLHVFDWLSFPVFVSCHKYLYVTSYLIT